MESNTVKIKDLPRLEEVLPGNLFVVEDETGSKALDFQDFVIGPENTSFYNGLATNITSVSTFSQSLCTTVNANINQTVNAVRTEMAAITANFSRRFPQIFTFQTSVAIFANDQFISFQFFAPTPSVTVGDLSFTNTVYFTGGPVNIFVSLEPPVIISGEGQSPLYQYVCNLSSYPVINEPQSLEVKVQRFY